jgi:hypothetical protein
VSAATTERISRPWWALVVAVLAFATAGWLVTDGHAGGTTVDHDQAAAHGDPLMLQVAPAGEVSFDSLPVEQQVLYQAAVDDREAFTAVRCYCGCEAFLEHRHLLDCFERPEGGWERHATGCAVCLAEAEEIVRYRGEGVPIDEIARRIDTKYGGITANT